MVGIGFFSPLPLAYMVPFMAAQSLAMGEAFGKGFQYGKRKISAQSNEEFNKFTFQNMWDEQNTNIKMLLPSLNSQLDSSIQLQKAIFAHMFELIPIFINELAKSTNTLVGNLTFQNTGDSANPLQGFFDYISNIWKIPEAGADSPPIPPPFIGPPKPLPDTLKQHQDIQIGLREPIQGPTEDELARGKELREDAEWVAWSTKLAKLKTTYQKLNRIIKNPTSSTPTQYRQAGTKNLKSVGAAELRRVIALLKNKKFSITSQIRSMSNDYRNANNNIRKNALALRASMSQWS